MQVCVCVWGGGGGGGGGGFEDIPVINLLISLLEHTSGCQFYMT